MIKTDCHMHTYHSSDSCTPMKKMIETSINLGLTEIAITDHLDYDEYGLLANDFNIENYYIEFLELKNKFKNKINLKLGIELGLGTHVKNKIQNICKKYPFDFTIGSTHSVNKKDIYTYRQFLFKNKDKETSYNIYLNEIYQNIVEFDEFCIYGHLDYLIRYAPFKNYKMHYEEFSFILDKILKLLIEKGKGIEINTSGFKYGLGEPHPSVSVIKRYQELGGEIITVGSDAHYPEDIGSCFTEAYEILKTSGFKAYSIFKDRKPIMIDI